MAESLSIRKSADSPKRSKDVQGDNQRNATDGEVKELRRKMGQYQQLLAESSLENNLLKKSLVGLEGTGTSE